MTIIADIDLNGTLRRARNEMIATVGANHLTAHIIWMNTLFHGVGVRSKFSFQTTNIHFRRAFASK